MTYKDIFGYAWTLFVGVAGLGLWQYQLIAKRRYEIVEQALTAVGLAVQALHQIRRTKKDVVDLAVQRNPKLPPPDLWLATHERLQDNAGVFENLDTVGRAIEMHFGKDAATLFRRLSSVHARLWEAQSGYWYRSDAEKVLPTDEQARQRDAWKAYLYAQASGDAVTLEIDIIDAGIKKAFGAYLRPNFWRLFFPPRGWKRS